MSELLGWEIGPPAESDWRGLTEYVSELRKVIGHSGPDPGA